MYRAGFALFLRAMIVYIGDASDKWTNNIGAV